MQRGVSRDEIVEAHRAFTQRGEEKRAALFDGDPVRRRGIDGVGDAVLFEQMELGDVERHGVPPGNEGGADALVRPRGDRRAMGRGGRTRASASPQAGGARSCVS